MNNGGFWALRLGPLNGDNGRVAAAQPSLNKRQLLPPERPKADRPLSTLNACLRPADLAEVQTSRFGKEVT